MFKLFPRVSYPGVEERRLQHAIGGSVSTYDLDVEGASAMIEGKLLPCKPGFLVSLLSITFVGMLVVAQTWLQSTFKV